MRLLLLLHGYLSILAAVSWSDVRERKGDMAKNFAAHVVVASHLLGHKNGLGQDTKQGLGMHVTLGSPRGLICRAARHGGGLGGGGVGLGDRHVHLLTAQPMTGQSR